MSYHKLNYHIVFGTKNRMPTIVVAHDRELYAYIYGIIKQLDGHVHHINGISDHVHILTSLPPTIAVSDAVKTIKQSSSIWLKANPNFPLWNGWAESFAALTYSSDQIEIVKKYIINQKEHHLGITFAEEYEHMVKSMGYDKLY